MALIVHRSPQDNAPERKMQSIGLCRGLLAFNLKHCEEIPHDSRHPLLPDRSRPVLVALAAFVQPEEVNETSCMSDR